MSPAIMPRRKTNHFGYLNFGNEKFALMKVNLKKYTKADRRIWQTAICGGLPVGKPDGSFRDNIQSFRVRI